MDVQGDLLSSTQVCEVVTRLGQLVSDADNAGLQALGQPTDRFFYPKFLRPI